MKGKTSKKNNGKKNLIKITNNQVIAKQVRNPDGKAVETPPSGDFIHEHIENSILRVT